MQIQAGKKQIEVKRLAKARKTNNFPDLLFFASGKVARPGSTAKFRIKLTDGGDKIKEWKKKVEYTEDFGNMFEGALLTKDDITGDFGLKFEVDTGAGYQTLDPVDAQEMVGGPICGR
jgi:hypothetical protein